MKRGILLLIALVVVALWCFPAMGQATGQEDRLKALEDKIQALQNELEEVKKEAVQAKEAAEVTKETFQGKKVTPAYSFWKNDFFLSTEDEEFWMKIRGNLHFDTKFYGGNSANPTAFDIRRVRMDFQGMWYDYIYFRIQAEFADSPYIRNAWVDYKFRDWLHLRGGQMKPPFSTSWWTTDNNVNFMERGGGKPIYSGFDRGWWIWGDVLDNTLAWNISTWTGTGTEKDDPKGDINDYKDWVARLFYSPFKNQDDSVVQGLHLCVEGSLGKQTGRTKAFEGQGKGYSAAIRDDKYWTWVDGLTDETIDSRDRWGAELHYILGPLSMSSEYLVCKYSDIEYVADGGKVSADGNIVSWSTWVAYFLTGEQKRVSNFGWKYPSPKNDFDPVHFDGTGAWEVLARYTSTKTSKALFQRGILDGADRVDEYTLGLSWTWNPLIRWQFNYVHLSGRGILTGWVDKNNSNDPGTKRVDHEDMFGIRMIFKF
ncbi:MAG: hypothetical protein BA872_03075 [Desulfobacterales bacterium C00003060]|nr:MAG: hypothetical protein BA861_06560 [Desulfobacterales bacterium S3730MH5]OEU78308.1 MAG: hypothetical protein BA872_03075 [Desulfobacterales bacterium C00003060]